MTTRPTIDDLFDRPITYPDVEARERLSRLIGLDEHKARLAKILGLLINPAGLDSWARKYHPGARGLLDAVLRRPPLVVLAGDVGSGKSELAETIGDDVARRERVTITLFPMSLSTRGQGRVGEMTQLLSVAFEHTEEQARKLKDTNGTSRGAVILLVDEADAIAQSREASQMHHEDRAGVNAFIRGIDRLANGKLPAAVIMCTNRLGSFGPGSTTPRSRHPYIHPSRQLSNVGYCASAITFASWVFQRRRIVAAVAATGPRQNGDYGFTFSDLTQRLLPAIVLRRLPRQCGGSGPSNWNRSSHDPNSTISRGAS